jgi:hypothetical protein
VANGFTIAAFVVALVSSATLLLAQSTATPSVQSSTTPSPAQTFNVCVGGFWNPLKENRCQSYDTYVFCLNPDNPPYKSAATNACKEAGKSGRYRPDIALCAGQSLRLREYPYYLRIGQ